MKILLIIGIGHKKYMENYNHFQRVYFLSRWTRLSILAPKGSDFSLSADPGTKIFRSFLNNKIVSFIYFFWWILLKVPCGNYDIIITEPSIFSVCGFWAKIISHIKWVVDIWDIPIRGHSQLFFLRLKNKIERFILKLLYQQADLFIVSILPGYELKEFRLPEKKMLLLKNAIWMKNIRQAKFSGSLEKPFNILCVRSRYFAEVGLDILAHAYRKVCRDINVSLTIIGKIPPSIRKQIDFLEDCPRVYFHDFIEHDHLLKMISEAWVCIVPFRNVPDLAQTYPIKVLECLAMGTPIIASNLDGIAKLIKHEWNGLLFDAGNADDLAHQMKTLYNNPGLREKLSQNARIAIDKKFDCEEKNKIILSHLEELINKRIS